MSKGKNKEKYFSIENKKDCIIYLQRIIATSEQCLFRLKRYNNELHNILQKLNKSETVPYNLYASEMDKTSNVVSYLLNILGDFQKSSISYYRYRDLIEKKLSKNNTEGIQLTPISDDVRTLLKKFNQTRNWFNHIPESLLNAEIQLIREGKAAPHSKNPIELNLHEFATYELLEDLYHTNVAFYEEARTLVQMCKKDYSLLIGETMRINKVFLQEPADVNRLELGKLSADIQGIKM